MGHIPSKLVDDALHQWASTALVAVTTKDATETEWRKEAQLSWPMFSTTYLFSPSTSLQYANHES